MSQPDPQIRSFIIRIRLESEFPVKGRRNWYGWIVEVPEGRRFYFRSLLEGFDLIAAALDRLGARVGWFWRVRALFRRKGVLPAPLVSAEPRVRDSSNEEEP